MLIIAGNCTEIFWQLFSSLFTSFMPVENSLATGKYNGLHNFMDGFEGRGNDL